VNIWLLNGHPLRPWAEDGRERVVYKVDVRVATNEEKRIAVGKKGGGAIAE
tara:strand:- start:107 stop:259 length:153 start_codon:yes stop_codon:yes gene_type:complete